MLKNIKLSDLCDDCFKDNTIIETKIYPIDYLLKGGLELGYIFQFVGDSAVGKSTIALQIAKSICEQGYNLLYLDSEGSITQEMLKTTGVMKHYNDQFYLQKCSKFDEVEKVLDRFISTGEISFIFIDSLAALINPGFVNLNHDKTKFGRTGISVTTNEAHVTSGPLTKFMTKYRSLATSQNICFVLINQYRTSIDGHYNTSTKLYGPKNVQYASDVIIKISDCASIGPFKSFKDFTKETSPSVGKPLEFEVYRSNKLSPGIKVPGYLKYGSGIDNMYSYFHELKENNIITQAGVYYSLPFHGTEIKEKGAISFIEKLRCENFNASDFKELISSNNSNIDSDGDMEV